MRWLVLVYRRTPAQAAVVQVGCCVWSKLTSSVWWLPLWSLTSPILHDSCLCKGVEQAGYQLCGSRHQPRLYHPAGQTDLHR